MIVAASSDNPHDVPFNLGFTIIAMLGQSWWQSPGQAQNTIRIILQLQSIRMMFASLLNRASWFIMLCHVRLHSLLDGLALPSLAGTKLKSLW